MFNQRPSVAAIMCVRNGRAFVAEALASIRRQTRAVDCLVVVDDGSTDGTAELVHNLEPEAHIVRSAPHGLAHARNLGVSATTADFLAFIDADDLWPPERTQALIEASLSNPTASLVCGRVRVESIGSRVVPDARLMQANGAYIPFLITSGLFKRSLWQQCGGMSPTHERSEDVDLYLRALEAGIEITRVNVEALIYRFHGGNRSREIDLSQAALLDTMHAAILRRRQAVRERRE
jgi:glycosyltransferase involved in cell wall biosynthesis